MTQPPVERRRKSWREFRLAYPGIISVLFVLLVSMVAIDGWLRRPEKPPRRAAGF